MIKYLKGECEQCGGHLEFPADSIGSQVQCPHCGKTTELRLIAPPDEPGVSKKAIAWAIGALVILSLSLIALLFGLRWAQNYAARHKKTAATEKPSILASTQTVTASQAVVHTEVTPTQDALQASSVSLEKPQGDSLVYAVGTVTNTSNRQRFGVRVQIDLLDGTGRKIGTAEDYHQLLEPGAQWRFKALVMKSNAASAKVAGIKED